MCDDCLREERGWALFENCYDQVEVVGYIVDHSQAWFEVVVDLEFLYGGLQVIGEFCGIEYTARGVEVQFVLQVVGEYPGGYSVVIAVCSGVIEPVVGVELVAGNAQAAVSFSCAKSSGGFWVVTGL